MTVFEHDEAPRRTRTAASRSPHDMSLRQRALGLQRTAGNSAVAGLMGGSVVQRMTAVPVQRVEHTTGAQLDAYAAENSLIGPYAKAQQKAGRTAAGHIHIHDAAGFKAAYLAYTKVKDNPATGRKFTETESLAREPKINAFQDGTELHLHEDRGSQSTAIHEGMHLLTARNFVGTVGVYVSEGMTEYFALKICADQKISRSGFYEKELESVRKLVAASSEQKVAAAYFTLDLKPLKKDVDKKGRRFKSHWKKWLKFMLKGEYAKADALL